MLKRYYSDKLEGRGYDAYYSIDGAIRAYRSDCMLYGLTEAEARRALEAFVYENPDVYACGVQFVQARREGQGVRLFFFYHECDDGKFAERQRAIFDELDKKIGAYTTDYDVAKLVYDYLASTVTPDNEVMRDYGRLNVNSSNEVQAFAREHGKAFTAYGAIVEKKAVCMGVSLAYKMILDHYRVEAAVATGTIDGGPHMLNVVETEGRRAFVDITRGFKEKDFPMVRYDAFMVNEERIKTYFEPNESFGCSGKQNEYFTKNGLCFKDGFSLRRYLNSFTFEKTKGQIRFLYEGKNVTDRQIGKMLGDIIPVRCGNEYELIGYLAENGVGNCMIKKREE